MATFVEEVAAGRMASGSTTSTCSVTPGAVGWRIARFGEMPPANATPVKGNGAAIIGAAHRVLDQPLRDLVGQFDVFGLTGLPEPGEGLVRCR